MLILQPLQSLAVVRDQAQRSGSEVSHGTEPQKIKGLPGASVIEFNTNMK